MQLKGIVTSAVDGTPIAQAEVLLGGGAGPIGKGYTDAAGAFHVFDASGKLTGAVLRCDVSKAGFNPTSLQRKVGAADVTVEIELAPSERPAAPVKVEEQQPKTASVEPVPEERPKRLSWEAVLVLAIVGAVLGLMFRYEALAWAGAAALVLAIYHRRRGRPLGFHAQNAAVWFGIFLGCALREHRVRDDHFVFLAFGLLAAVIGSAVVMLFKGGRKKA